MRIAIAYSNRRIIGGIETYLSSVIPGLSQVGHQLAFWHEVEGPIGSERITLPIDAPSWCVGEIGAQDALSALRAWQPDLIYAHGLYNQKLEAELLKIAPAVFFAHGYYGTCISGTKAFKRPTVIPCNRKFGWPCLLHYYPHRCGGLSPITMLKMYGMQSERLQLLAQYKAIVTHSDHMISEYERHGLYVERAYHYDLMMGRDEEAIRSSHLGLVTETNAETSRQTPLQWQLLFSGRMHHLKGGAVFLNALPKVSAKLGARLQVTFAGDGGERANWERLAKEIQATYPLITIEFTGWLDGHHLEELVEAIHLLVVPSIWPEPFGLVGMEAAVKGVPTAAFAVGGIQDWLTDGVNGFLAPGDPPTADGLAEAILNCLRDPMVYARLRLGAVELAQRFSLKNHLEALVAVFDKVVQRPPVAVSG